MLSFQEVEKIPIADVVSGSDVMPGELMYVVISYRAR